MWHPKKSSISWAKLIIKVYEVDPLKCEQCGLTMKIIAYITKTTSIHRILVHIGRELESGKGKRVKRVKALMDDLNADD